MKIFESWTCFSNESNSTSKISNRCKHRSHTCQTHILNDFTRQFSTTNSQATPLSMSNHDDGSAYSDADHTVDSSSAQSDETDAQISRGSGSAIRSVGSSQPPFKRQSQAFPAAFEDSLQTSSKKPASANTRGTEFFELSPR